MFQEFTVQLWALVSRCTKKFSLVWLDCWPWLLNVCKCVSDYLKNLPEDSDDYKDTQGTPSSFFTSVYCKPTWWCQWNGNMVCHVCDVHIFKFFYSFSCPCNSERGGQSCQRHHETRGENQQELVNQAYFVNMLIKCSIWVTDVFFSSQDNFQKLIQVQCSLNGQHEIVQPGRVRL